MARLLKSQLKGMAVQADSRPPIVRDINVEIWANVNIEYREKSFPTGSMALFYARKERFNRDSTGDTKDMLWVSPLIQKDPSLKPQWVHDLLATLTSKTILGYEGPRSPGNVTNATIENHVRPAQMI